MMVVSRNIFIIFVTFVRKDGKEFSSVKEVLVI